MAITRASALKPDLLSAIDAICECSHVPAGERVYSVGEPAHSVYIVLSGRVQGIRLTRQGTTVVVGEVGRGNVFGLMSIMENETYRMTATAVRETHLARLSREDFERLGHEHPRMLLKVTRLILEFMRDFVAGAPTSCPVRTITLLPADGEVAAEAIAEKLADALAAEGPVLVAHRDMIDEITAGGAGADVIRQRLEELECGHDFVVYPGSASPDRWNDFCLERADRVLLVGRSGTSPDRRSPVIAALRRFQKSAITKCDLVLLRGGAEPAGTGAWLDVATFDRWHQVGVDRAADVARLARCLAARTTALVLSGGGARGFAHLGVFRALQEAGIAVDFVAGTSMGGIMGAALACGWDYPTMVEAARRTFVQSKPLRDFTLPVISFVSGKRISRLLRETFGDRLIEDLPLPFLCVSCDLSDAQAAYHRTGSLWEALRATVAIPAVISPTVRGGHVHVDGGAIDNMPVEYVRRLGVGRIIAVDVSPLDSFASNLADTDSLMRSSWLFGGRLDGPRPPSLISILRRSGSVSSMALQRQAQVEADRSVDLHLEGVRMLDFSRLEEIADLGYQAAREQIAEWPEFAGGDPA
jgi:NTE family protein